jgi:hypothetical protein
MKRGQIFRLRWKDREGAVTRNGAGYVVTLKDSQGERAQPTETLAEAQARCRAFVLRERDLTDTVSLES